MTTTKAGIVKSVFVGCAFIGLIGWLAVLQTKYDDIIEKVNLKEENVGRSKRASGNQSPSPPTGGAIYNRWGRTVCPPDAELVYKGFAGGQWYLHTGGAAEVICLSETPTFAGKSSAGEGTAWIYGVELELSITSFFSTANSNPNPLHNSDLQCAVCRSKTRSSKIMIPGTKECTPGWNMEYWGYLMTGHYNHKHSMDYVCVDQAPEAGLEGGARNDEGALLYHVQGSCGSLPCQPYVNGFELTCVVCTK